MPTNILFRRSTTPDVPTTTSVKGSPLTSLEIDGNFKSIKDDIDTITGETGSEYVGYTASGPSAVATTVHDKLTRRIDFEDYTNTAGGVLDATADLQALVNYAIGQGITEIGINSNFRLAGTVTVNGNVTFVGRGFKSLPSNRGTGIPESGTWLIHDNPTGPMFKFTGFTSIDAGLKNLAIYQTGHPEPGPGWAPAVRNFVINQEFTSGSLRLEKVHFHNVYRGVRINLGARPVFTDITGQFFRIGFAIDQMHDIGKIEGVHAWTFWSEHDSVLSWEQSNAVLFDFGRVDGMWMDRIFAFTQSIVIFLSNNSAAPVGPGGKIITIGGLYCDFCERAIVVESALQCHLSVDFLFFLGDAWKISPPTSLPDACAIDVNNGQNHLVQISNLYSYMTAGEAVRIHAAATESNLWIDSFIATNVASIESGSGAAICTATNLIRFGNKPFILNKAGGRSHVFGSYQGGLAFEPVMEHITDRVVNKPAVAGGNSGNPVLYSAQGDPSVDVVLTSNMGVGDGSAILGSATNKVGFYGSPGSLKPTVTGSTGGNVALQNLLAQLAALNLITNSTT